MEMKVNCSLLLQFVLFLVFLFGSYDGKETLEKKNDAKRDVLVEEIKENFLLRKKLHKLKSLTQKASKRLATKDDYTAFREDYLKNILRVRVPGSVGHREVKEFIIGKLKDYGWTVELDEFVKPTPLGDKKFTNVIATLNPQADRRLALAAHYDSKLIEPKDGKYFLAATDSAVPCAMLLDFAKLFMDKADKRGKTMTEVTPMLIFLDGEEAFVEWNENDSIYGSRHLANELMQKPHHSRTLSDASVNMLESLDAFVLLDLIGFKNPQFLNLFPSQTSHLYERLQKIEKNLRKGDQLVGRRTYFPGTPYEPIRIEDDHVPFLQKNVPILHMISVPFPDVWHKLEDDEEHLDPESIVDLLKIFRQFVLEYFHLS